MSEGMRDNVREISMVNDVSAARQTTHFLYLSSASVPPGGFEQANVEGLTSPGPRLLRIRGIYFHRQLPFGDPGIVHGEASAPIPAPVGATTGTHGLRFRMRDTFNAGGTIALFEVPHNSDLIFDGFYFRSSHVPVAERPVGHAAQVALIKDLITDQAFQLQVIYFNNTNVAQTATNRRCILVFQGEFNTAYWW